MENEIYGIRRFHTIVVGTGAAGFCAADRLKQYGVSDVAMVTENRFYGTSRNTGSDKQTYYKLSLAGEDDDSTSKLAGVLFSGGCMDGDHALCEAALSCQGFFKLVELGVPFPQNRYGEFAGYKTDHDPNWRGTSAGPYTSRYMTEVLERSAEEKGIPVIDHHQVIRILVSEGEVYGLLCLNTETGSFVVFECTYVVYATGGPASIYRDSVYPDSQSGASGLAFEAGVLGKNLTEWQYGLASVRPRWNVSGSYMQVLPRFVSTDEDGGDEKEFLSEHFKNREEMLHMVFLKGYQWPFDVRKAKNGSSAVDLLVYREKCLRGRRVWLDYRSNPGGQAIDFSCLNEEAGTYLKQAGACQDTPFKRLVQLNEPAAAFYREHGVDLETEMLEVAVCAQHNNGGLSVDAWWQTGVEGLFAIGEAAGTHGIYRPGGSALNSGQVGAARAAAYIAAHKEPVRDRTEKVRKELKEQIMSRIRMGEGAKGRKADLPECRREAQSRMSRSGAMVRDLDGIRENLVWVEEELQRLWEYGLTKQRQENCTEETAADSEYLSFLYRYYDMLLCQKVYLSAMKDYSVHGGKSRGSSVYLASSGAEAGTGSILPAFILDGPDGRDHASVVQEIIYSLETDSCTAQWRNVRPIPERNGFFEVIWKEYREKKLF